MKSSRWRVLSLVCACSGMLVRPTAAAAASYQVSKDSEVSFLARITASSFVAKSTALSGVVDYDQLSGVLKSALIKVKADSFETGMGLRDEHLRDKYLEAPKFPEIVFQVEGAKVAAAPNSESALDGFFIIKGVKKPAKVAVKVIDSARGHVGVVSTFKLNVTDFGIPQPKFTMVKMETIIDVTLKLILEAKGS